MSSICAVDESTKSFTKIKKILYILKCKGCFSQMLRCMVRLLRRRYYTILATYNGNEREDIHFLFHFF